MKNNYLSFLKRYGAIALSAMMISIFGCSCAEPSQTPFLPVCSEPGLTQMEAYIEGELILSEGCIRLKPAPFGKSYLLIWPYGYKSHIKGETVQILNADDQVVACVGDRIGLGGGVTELTEFIENDVIGQPLPTDCTGPYWIIGEIGEIID